MKIKNYTYLLIVTFALALAAGPAMAQHDHGSPPPKAKGRPGKAMPPVEKINLSPQLKELLAEEMQAISQGMSELLPAIAQGDGEKVGQIGDKMRESYILSQKLSPQQMEELHHALPKGFAAMDHDFHAFAGMMASAGRTGQWNVIPYLVYRITEGCVNCHATYATDRFPTLAGKATGSRSMEHMRMGMKKGKGEHQLMHMKEHKKMRDADWTLCAPSGKVMKQKGKKGCILDDDGNCLKEDCPLHKSGDCPMQSNESDEHSKKGMEAEH